MDILKLIAKDAEEWGTALNNASWKALEAYRTQIGPDNAEVFNGMKSVIRVAILEYLKRLREES